MCYISLQGPQVFLPKDWKILNGDRQVQPCNSKAGTFHDAGSAAFLIRNTGSKEKILTYIRKRRRGKKKKKGATVNITEHKLLERQVHVKEGIASRDKTVLFYQLQVSLQLLQFQGTVHSKKKDTYICIFFPGKSWIYRSPSQDSEQELRGSLPKPKEILRIYH